MKPKLIFLSLSIIGLLICGCNNRAIPTSEDTESLVHVHTFGEEWKTNETHHWHAATCEHKDLKSNYESHEFGDWVVDKQATEYKQGLKYKTCYVCNYRIEEIIDLLPHTHKPGEAIEENRIEPTCTERGSYDLVVFCTECLEELTREHYTINSLGHDYGEWSITVPATCTDDGEETRICSRDCSHIETRTIEAIGHDWGEWVLTTEPTCLDKGTETRICSHDLNHVETREVDALGHNLIHHNAKSATCTESGWDEYDTCSRCDYSTQIIIPPTGHQHTATRKEQMVEPTCTKDGSFDEVIYCLDDDVVISRTKKVIPALGHDLVHHNAKSATCTESGWDEYDTCSRCDYTNIVEKNAIGHNFGSPTYSWNDDYSQCTASRVCQNDPSHIETETVDSNYTVVSEPSYETNGVGRYIVSFTNTFFDTQTQDVVISQLDKLLYICLNDHCSVKAASTLISGDITILNEYNGLPVTSINENAFMDCIKITSVTIPEGITSIGSAAFFNCQNLELITLPESLISIGDECFVQCYKLMSISIPNGIKSVGSNLFTSCSSMTYTEEDNLFYVGNDSNPYLCLLSMHDPFLEITSVDVNNQCKVLANGVFSKKSLISITLPNQVISIPVEAFKNCSLLESINIPNTVEKIGEKAFYGCTSLISVYIPDTVINIEREAFAECLSLEEMSLPFVGGNKYAKEPSNSTLFGFIFGKEKTFSVKDGKIAEIWQEYDYGYGCGMTSYIPLSLKTITIRSGKIFFGAFQYCSMLEKINLPDNLNEIYDNVFCGCTSLKEIIIPVGVKAIGSLALWGCSSLTSINIPEGVDSLGFRAIGGCASLESITLPSTLNHIDICALSGCTSLSTIRFGGTMEQWASVELLDNWNENTPANCIQCTNGEITITN